MFWWVVEIICLQENFNQTCCDAEILLLFCNYFNNYLIVLVGDVSFSNQTFIKPLNYPPTPAYKKSHNYYPWKCELKEPDKPSIRRNIYLKQIISFSPWSVYSYHTLFNCQRMFLISPEIEYLIVRFFYLKKMERKKPDNMKDEYNDFDV